VVAVGGVGVVGAAGWANAPEAARSGAARV
jgi:hypothetical protein